MIALADILVAGTRQQTISLHGGQYYSLEQFNLAVGHWMDQLSAESATAYALYSDDAYPFAVLLFALLHAGKQVWLPGNKQAGCAQLLEQRGCRLIGDWHSGFDYCLDIETTPARHFLPLHPQHSSLVMFTSGSTGAAKPIWKRLCQLQTEIEALEKIWGRQLADSQVLATVSHQHIYGLLFRLLWPLAAGRCFHSKTSLSVETLLKQTDNTCLISSPAYLKRLDHHTDWGVSSALIGIFSSGGTLSAKAVEQIYVHSGLSVIEVYGSTETGGIGWRQQDTSWTLFDGLSISKVNDGILLTSPYLPNSEPVHLDDALALQDDGRFLLHGRNDRIVKIEEKRLSLNELEQRLVETIWLEDAAVLILKKNRDTVAAVTALSAEGKLLLQTEGRKTLIKRLRTALKRWFDWVVLPRNWLFLETIPLTELGKPNWALLLKLLGGESGKLPLLHGAALSMANAVLQLKVPQNLVYFPDHFAAYPILPGVVQIGWAEYYGKLLFPVSSRFLQLEAIKFVKPIQPGLELNLQLSWKSESNKLYFSFASAKHKYSSGRLLYAPEPL